MKINPVQTAISIAVSALIAYGFYNFNNGDFEITLAIGTFIFLSITSVVAIGLTIDNGRATVNTKVLASIFYVIGFVINLIFMFLDFSQPFYIILNGILILTFISIAYGVGKAKQ